jgi:hypothetical protein
MQRINWDDLTPSESHMFLALHHSVEAGAIEDYGVVALGSILYNLTFTHAARFLLNTDLGEVTNDAYALAIECELMHGR